MIKLEKHTLKKELGFLDVFAIGAGAMISSGLFVLPAIAFAKAGPAVILAYFLASILMIPSVLSQTELATAMPRAGGSYFYIERSMGPVWGLFSGFANWFSLALKSAFAIVGTAVFIDYLVQNVFGFSVSGVIHKEIAVVCCVIFTAMNIVSVKATGRFQVVLVIVLIGILAFFAIAGLPSVSVKNYAPFAPGGFGSVIKTIGLVFISYAGLTKVASVAEEVKNPAKILPAAMISAWLIVSVFYVIVVAITVGVMPSGELSNTLTPISVAASKFLPTVGFPLLATAAIAAFITTANGGILAASRSPMAMSRDGLLPPMLARVNKKYATPHISILVTFLFMTLAIIFLDIELLVKTASTLGIILFMLVNLSVIFMRESRITSYKPKFRSPLYPYIQILAIVVYAVLLAGMGLIPLAISAGFVILSTACYFFYSSPHVSRGSAAMHIVERITDRQIQTVTLENELRDILIERDEIVEDRFDILVRECPVFDLKGQKEFQPTIHMLAEILESRLDTNQYVLVEKFIEREATGGTVVQPGLAIPHVIVDGTEKFDLAIVRAADGIKFPHAEEPVKIMFVLAGSKDERNFHLRALMAIAQITQEKDFEKRWFQARDEQALRNILLLSQRKRETL